ncbi:MAG: extracellular solute-binding protein [Salinirussus sp.]
MGARTTLGRRALLATIGGSLAGCGTVLGRGRRPVSILAAGSLTNALVNGLVPGLDVPVQVETHGSARVARLVANGSKAPDIVSIADPVLFETILSPAWYATFATNAIVLAYNPSTPGGRRIEDEDAATWYQPLLSGNVTLGRTDPDLDPLGYRTLFTLDLATDHYDLDADLRSIILRHSRVYPETQLLGRFETGAIDAAFVYRSMAADRGFDFLELPSAIDLSEPALADRYSMTAYELPDGTTIQGAPISYAATIRNHRPAVEHVFRRHISGESLRPFGFDVPDDYPRYTGDVPNWFD